MVSRQKIRAGGVFDTEFKQEVRVGSRLEEHGQKISRSITENSKYIIY